jgi:hypothetical protein
VESCHKEGEKMKRRYQITKKWKGDYGETIYFDGKIEIDDVVIDAVDDSWRKLFYDFTRPQQIAEHIAFNMIVNDLTLSRIDGFANLSNDLANLVRE